ncbi:zinc-dependent metalloprotease [Inhella sp. 4Y17]|uniref:Zinc-dependent metalloprotease n=1 Tax=Inhella gelatinilytica TaxID=2795030 RepID=A0A931IYA4_9BURK|nr:zinc-dependent metalloprotease [Inhella gelatinilytica]
MWALSAVSLALMAATGAQAQTPPANGAAPAAAPSPAQAAAMAAARAAADATALKPFADVSKDAKSQDGVFSIWKKDEKTWLEVPRSMLNKPFLFTVNIANAVGERGLYASQMGFDVMVEFRLVGRNLQLVALNDMFRAKAEGKASVAQAFSPSLLANTAVASADHPERKSFLVDASFLLSDFPMYSTRLEMAYRMPYGLDRANSSFVATRADAQLSTFTGRMHFATPRIPAPPLMPMPVPMPPPPQTLPDPRSLFVDYVINLRALPEQQAAVRHIDPRLGHFMTSYTDMDSDIKPNNRVHMLNRWRLEKADAAAAVSEPKQPIVYWLDKNIPARYREAVKAGILEWNKAFEKIGFKNAVVVKQQPDDADWDNMDANHASIRWFVGADVGFAIGPSHVDPRTGEILDADIGMSDVFARGSRRFLAEDVSGHASHGDHDHSPAALPRLGSKHQHAAYCNYTEQAASEMNFAMDLLEARGDIAPDSPEAEAFVNAVIKDVIMHEVGHTLGLKHNFKASTVVTQAQLKDKAFVEANGLSASVMDYNAYNIPLKGEKPTALTNTQLGAYDYWAIEYAYKPLDPATEKQELDKIASRSTEPQLIYADDMDAGVGGPYDGMDPLANRFDLGDDPLGYFQKRLQLSKELWERVQTRGYKPGDDPTRARRSLMAGFQQLGRGAESAAKYVGGMSASREAPGTNGKSAFTPIAPAKQREALKTLTAGLFSSDSFKFRPEFLSNLQLDYNEWDRGVPADIGGAVLRLQMSALSRLMSIPTAKRLLDLPGYLSEKDRKGAISLAEVYGSVQGAIWSELKTGAEIDRTRRALQREYLRGLIGTLTRGGAVSGLAMPADALAMLRWNARLLQADLQAAAAKGGSVETRAHVAESLSALSEALKATMVRM